MWNRNNPADSEIKTSVEDAFKWIGWAFMRITKFLLAIILGYPAMILFYLAMPIFWVYVAYEIIVRVFGDHSGALVIFTSSSYGWFWPFMSAVSAGVILYVVGLLVILDLFYYITIKSIYDRGRFGGGDFQTFVMYTIGLCILAPVCLAVYYLYHPLFNLLKSWF